MAEKISISTGWKLHFDPVNNNPETFNAIEVVQSNRLGYAAVAAGAGALLLGARNRRNSKK